MEGGGASAAVLFLYLPPLPPYAGKPYQLAKQYCDQSYLFVDFAVKIATCPHT